MQIQATYKRSEDSLKLLENLNDIAEFQGANLRILFNSRSAEDRKLLQLLAASAGKSKPRFSPKMLMTAGITAIGSMGFIAYGLVGLFGYK